MTAQQLKVTYREYLTIKHSLECYAEKWLILANDLREIRDNEHTCPAMKERCEHEILKLDFTREEVLHLLLNLMNQARESYKVPEHIFQSFQDPEQND